ncbi:MAG TPA: PilZ domain-containing protein [Syntrophales bacterium]|nr:PilZ domain-containing protein [Syntrophales bacterium]
MFEPTLTSVISLGVVFILVFTIFMLIIFRSKEDRRISKRVEVNCNVKFRANGTNYSAKTQDISLTGLSIETAHQLDLDAILDIVIELPDNKTSTVKGKVVRTIEHGIGVNIIENNSDYMRYYKYLLSKQK